MRYGLIAVTLAVLGTALWAQGPGPRRDGNWEVTLEMQMPGMPMTMPAQTIMQCITPQQAADPQNLAPPSGRGQSSCKVSDYKVDGNKVTFSLSCPNEGMTGTAEFIYTADSYAGTMKMNMQGQSMSMKYTGKRLGDCTR
jgi:hypothetical protein